MTLAGWPGFYLTVQSGWFCDMDNFQGMSILGVSFCLPAHPSIHPLSTCILAPPRAGKQEVGACFVCASVAVSKQPKMKMMLTVKADLEVMMLHQIGRKLIWCQQKTSKIEECCWHQRRILPRWYSIFSRLPSHHHEKASKWYSIGMPGTENLIHALPKLHEFYECRNVGDDWPRLFHKFALSE